MSGNNRNQGPRPAHATQDPVKAELQQIQHYLQQASDKSFVPVHPATYGSVTVVLTHFDNDDLGIANLERDLGIVFKDWFGYKTQHHRLPGSIGNPRVVLTNILYQLIASGAAAPGNLVILVFSGHGEVRTESVAGGTRIVEKLHVGGRAWNGKLVGSTLKWKDTVELLEDSGADVLHILDCCYATEAAVPSAEMLAATSATDIATANIATSFTAALIQQLKQFATNGITVADLFARMLSERKALNLEHSPVYTPRPGDRPSIVIVPKGTSFKKDIVVKTTAKHPRILLTAHVEPTLNRSDIHKIEKWITSTIPKAVTNIEVAIEGFFDHDSTLVLLSMPVSMWSQLADAPSFNFVSMVYSRNLMLQSATAPSVLESRPVPKFGENAPPNAPAK